MKKTPSEFRRIDDTMTSFYHIQNFAKTLNERPYTAFFLSSAFLLVLNGFLFHEFLFTSREIILSDRRADLFSQFVFWRDFGFSQLKNGNLALWNPHIYSGTPFFAGFQSALLYPPNALYLFLPLHKAINFGIILHVWLGGVFMYLWASFRKLSPPASFFTAVIFMLSGAHFLHIFAGHLTNLCAMIWAPLIFLSVDGLFRKPSVAWPLLGAFSVAMQIFAGHPQYVFFTGVAAVAYFGFQAVQSRRFHHTTIGFFAIYLIGSALAAVQLISGLDAAGETVRSIGLTYDFAAMFSFPPENFLTLIAPRFFGNVTGPAYWGRCYLWEMSLFISISGLVSCVYAAFYGDKAARSFSLSMIVILFVLALGAHTPLFDLLYHHVPGFDKFRSHSKFIFQATLFLSMLSGVGLDRLIKGGTVSRRLPVGLIVAGCIVASAAFFIWRSAKADPASAWWPKIMQSVYETKESYLPQAEYSDAKFVSDAGIHAAGQTAVAAGTIFLLAGLFFGIRVSRKFVPAVVLLAVVELVVFAGKSIDSFELKDTKIDAVEDFLARNPGDYRVMNLMSPNSGMSNGARDLWGYDPGVLLRYAQFMYFSQGYDPDSATQYLSFKKAADILNMLRLQYVFYEKDNKVEVYRHADPLPRLFLVNDYRIVPQRDRIFAMLASPEFDPRKTVILETPPEFEPAASERPGSVRLIESSTDHLVIEAVVDRPSVLLVTDLYAKGWKAVGLEGGARSEYDIVPANYILRAVSLDRGRHLIRMEYRPRAFEIGKWVSIVSWVLFIGALCLYIRFLSSKKSGLAEKGDAKTV